MAAFLEALSADILGTPVWFWLSFVALVVALLAFDLGVLHRGRRVIGVAESLWQSGAYTAIALAFGAWVWLQRGAEAGAAFFTGFLVEKSLALDNVFVISVIFAALAVPREYQHRVLVWGVLGVIVLRAIVIGLGAAVVARFDWILYLFGAFLLLTGVKLLVFGGHAPGSGTPRLLGWLRARLPVTEGLHGDRFLVRSPDPASGRMRVMVTPLFLALILVETADLVFAIDSVPAIFAITTDPFVVYTSNIFAILGLRALYFALAALTARFRHLGTALALILVFIGGKVFWSAAYGKVDPTLSLAVTMTLLAGGIVASLLSNRNGRGDAAAVRESA
jgi:tellurite resistance protein TerC